MIVHEGKETQFVGYDQSEVDGVSILKFRSIKSKDKVEHQLVLDTTPFYAEGGVNLVISVSYKHLMRPSGSLTLKRK